MIRPPESALVVLVPEAEPLVRSFRERDDPSAAAGVPAHVTILYPFIPPELQTQTHRNELAAHFSQIQAFNFSLTELRRFPNVLYLAPEPAAAFRELIRVTAARFPEFPPYGGAFSEIIPHLTLAELPNSTRLDEVAADFQQQVQDRLPLSATASEVAWLDNQDGPWQVRARFSLNGA